MSSITHGKLITSQTFYDGEVKTTEQEMVVSLFTTKQTILRDVIDALAVISNGDSHRLDLEICLDSKGRYRLVKRWSV